MAFKIKIINLRIKAIENNLDIFHLHDQSSNHVPSDACLTKYNVKNNTETK